MKTILEILDEYSLRRAAAIASAREKKEELFSRCPSLFELNQKKQEILLSSFEETLKNPAQANLIRQKTDKKAALIEKRFLEELLNLGAKPEDIEPKWRCEICEDTGYINKKPCRCFLERIYEDYLGAKPIKTLSSFEDWSNEVFP